MASELAQCDNSSAAHLFEINKLHKLNISEIISYLHILLNIYEYNILHIYRTCLNIVINEYNLNKKLVFSSTHERRERNGLGRLVSSLF